MEHPVTAFGLDYAGELIFCEAKMRDAGYDIYFDARWVAAIEYTENFSWIQAEGAILPDSIVSEIGHRVHEHYM